MIRTIRMKIIFFFLIILVSFVCLSASISYIISKKILFNSYTLSKENEMTIIVDDIKGVTSTLIKDIDVFSNNLKNQIPKIKKSETNKEDLYIFLNDINSYLKSILYSREFIQSFCYIENNFNISISLEETPIYHSFGIQNIVGKQTNISQDTIIEILKKSDIPFCEEYVVFSQVDKDSYIVAILDIQKIMEQTNKKLAIMNADKTWIQSNITDASQWENIHNTLALMGNKTSFSKMYEKNIVSVLMDHEDIFFVLVSDIQSFQYQLSRIKKQLVFSSVILCILFTIIIVLESKYIVKPIQDFNTILYHTNDGNLQTELKQFISNNQKKKSIYQRIYSIFLVTFIPVLIILSISLFNFRILALENTYQGYLDIAKQISNNIKNKVYASRQYMKDIILDQHLQEILNNKEYEKNDFEFAKVILDKGVLNKDISSIAIYSADKKLLYRSNHSSFMQLDDTSIQNSINHKILFRTKNNEINLVQYGEVKYLPLGNDKNDFLKTIGYVEMEMINFLDQKFKLLAFNPRLSQYLFDEDFNIVAKYGNDRYESKQFKTLLNRSELEEKGYMMLNLDADKTFITYVPIEQTDWYLALFCPPETFDKNNILTLVLINGVLFNFLLGFILIVSKILGDIILKNIKQFKEMMENIDEDYSVSNNKTSYFKENEFVMLAQSFNLMLKNLKEMSDQLRKKELENIHLNVRRKQTLLTAYQFQIKPHFLNNIITSIILLLKSNQIETATKMLMTTGKFFRSSLYGVENIITLKEEIEHAKYYLTLQQIRFGPKLQFDIQINEKYYNCSIPKFTLQPIIENAIEHGMEEEKTLYIQVFIREVTTENYVIYIKDNGRGIDQETIYSIYQSFHNINKEHYGLCCVNERIQLQYGQFFGIEIAGKKGEGTMVKVKMPFVKKEEKACLD